MEHTQFPSPGQHGQVRSLWFESQIFILVPATETRGIIYLANLNRNLQFWSASVYFTAAFWLQAFKVRWSWPRPATRWWFTSRTLPLSLTVSAQWGYPTGNTLKVMSCTKAPLVNIILFLCADWLTDSQLHSRWHESLSNAPVKELKELFSHSIYCDFYQ